MLLDVGKATFNVMRTRVVTRDYSVLIIINVLFVV
jgi:hypothetical protein